MSDFSQGPGWWQASDGKWYPPESAMALPPPPAPPAGQSPYYAGYQLATQHQRGTNGLAIASMVLGILWLYWIGSILALVFGYIALRQIKERNENGRGMAIAGTVLGWVGIGSLLLVIIAAIATHSSS